ncbi:trimeric LpxA-like protein [Phakopsora pachyrhizi]|uniref:mannose-1-phosphate guanylyltransferase n=1 Tax=Phakopsora pachyrhizi TaxID=170000 RepID=A0AAV0ANH8_PHAPC|nr:trimeric LpxA-like protein [Phakopsora pachyrhizi]CAH7670541.1 trimeric LpxA-like protein [Phakopsora pachyrhizi]
MQKLYHFRDAILKGFPKQIYVLHSDIASSFPLSELKIQDFKELLTRFGCIVTNPETAQALHYIEKPESFLSNTINTDDPLRPQDDQLCLEQDVIAPLANRGKLYVYQTKSSWKQIKSAGSALPANALVLESYKSNNPIVEPCYIDETAVIDPSAKIGPNVSIGANVRIRFGARVRDSIILDNTILEQNSCVLFSILGEDNKIGAWARVEGAPIPLDGTVEKNNISVLAKDVEVKSEVHVRSCIVLPHKSLGRSSAKEVLL